LDIRKTLKNIPGWNRNEYAAFHAWQNSTEAQRFSTDNITNVGTVLSRRLGIVKSVYPARLEYKCAESFCAWGDFPYFPQVYVLILFWFFPGHLYGKYK